MPITFPHFRQRDAMDCGPTCLRMIAAFYGKNYTLPFLRNHSHISREGVSLEGISHAAEQVGFRTMAVKMPFLPDKINGDDVATGLLNAPLPCVLHWHQNHFVVATKVTPQYIWIADPAQSVFKLPRSVFEQSWLSDGESDDYPDRAKLLEAVQTANIQDLLSPCRWAITR